MGITPMEKPATSEEKLLKLIRRKNSSPDAGGGEGSLSKKKFPREDASSPNARGDFLKRVNRLLALTALVLLVSMAVNYVLFMDEPANVISQPDMETASVEIAPKEIPAEERRPFGDYQESIVQRDIFQSPWEKEKDEKAVQAPQGDLQRKLKLVGIVLDEDPKAIIEDLEAHQTHFLSVGESVGDARVEEILEGKVILTVNEEKVELVQ